MVTLGIELDSVNQLARLPNDKLTSLLNLLHRWSSYRWCTKRQLQSLSGHLHHAAKVVWPGHAFIRRMINLLHNFRRDDHPIRLSAEFKKDLRWWLQYLASWNGVCFWVYPGPFPPFDLEMASDASGSLRFVLRTHWLYGKIPSALQSALIEYKELFPIVIAAQKINISSLEKDCLALMSQGLAPSTRTNLLNFVFSTSALSQDSFIPMALLAQGVSGPFACLQLTSLVHLVQLLLRFTYQQSVLCTYM